MGGQAMEELKTFSLPAGTVVKRGGIPFRLLRDTEIECHPENWGAIQEGFKPTAAIDGQAFVRNQSTQGLDIPQVDQPFLTSATTINSSLASSSDFSKSRI